VDTVGMLDRTVALKGRIVCPKGLVLVAIEPFSLPCSYRSCLSVEYMEQLWVHSELHILLITLMDICSLLHPSITEEKKE
jgi:flagellar assembly factor FliW